MLLEQGCHEMAKQRRKSVSRSSKSRPKVVSPTQIRRMAKKANANLPPFPAEGMARCICNAGMEKELRIGEVVYLREIPNMGGHCVILRNMKLPLVGYHLDRFEILSEDEA